MGETRKRIQRFLGSKAEVERRYQSLNGGTKKGRWYDCQVKNGFSQKGEIKLTKRKGRTARKFTTLRKEILETDWLIPHFRRQTPQTTKLARGQAQRDRSQQLTYLWT